MRDAQHQLGARRWLCQLWFLWCLLAICVVPRAVLAFCAGNSLRIEDALARSCDATDVRQSSHGCGVTTSSHDANYLPHARGTSTACEHAFAGEVAPPQAISCTIDVVARLLTAPRMVRVGAPLHLGMPKDLVASDGAIAWSATHSAYGRVIATYADEASRARYGTAINSPFRLLGQVADDDAELCFTRYRCFDPEIGSWISTDPLEIAGGLNLYGFDGAPTDVVDPLGLNTGGGDPHAKASELPVIRQGTKEWDDAVKELSNLKKDKINFRTETASDAKALLEQSRGKMDRRKQYTEKSYKKGYEVHNDQNDRELAVGNDRQHLKWKDGKSGGHIFYDKPN